jgi:hypothetical protein
MSFSAIIVVNAVLDVLLLVGLTRLLSWPRSLRPHGKIEELLEEAREIVEGIGHGEPTRLTDD